MQITHASIKVAHPRSWAYNSANVDSGAKVPHGIASVLLQMEAWWENPLPTSWEDMAGAERLATGTLLAYRSSCCAGSQRSYKLSSWLKHVVRYEGLCRSLIAVSGLKYAKKLHDASSKEQQPANYQHDPGNLLQTANDRELHFSMVDGDFKKFEGKWRVKCGRRLAMTTLSYEVNVIPRFNFPAIFLERIIRSDLPINLQALACRAERCFAGNLNVPLTQSPSAATSMVSFTSAGIDIDSVIYEENKHSSGEFKDNYASSNFGPLSPSTSEVNSNWGAFGKFCKLGRPCMVDEVHLRRFDGLLENGGVHRCVFASITVKAPVREVWHVLTSYESLPEIVPNLAISKILSRENNKVRILQVFTSINLLPIGDQIRFVLVEEMQSWPKKFSSTSLGRLFIPLSVLFLSLSYAFNICYIDQSLRAFPSMYVQL
ncbi:hypothetical protein RJ640_026112 [Escallonia rubra]|uniref:Coenzyme Q-binding protein COQ10 START domain-containing protein n=1 Tax=Escallonia rubra TaxID=112253 RepID=A0AA88U7V6_9ASTE|nr:hypothetical protein RJ640_026112 [Escallonia rubra]